MITVYILNEEKGNYTIGFGSGQKFSLHVIYSAQIESLTANLDPWMHIWKTASITTNNYIAVIYYVDGEEKVVTLDLLQKTASSNDFAFGTRDDLKQLREAYGKGEK